MKKLVRNTAVVVAVVGLMPVLRYAVAQDVVSAPMGAMGNTGGIDSSTNSGQGIGPHTPVLLAYEVVQIIIGEVDVVSASSRHKAPPPPAPAPAPAPAPGPPPPPPGPPGEQADDCGPNSDQKCPNPQGPILDPSQSNSHTGDKIQCAKGTIAIALPVLSGGANCVSNAPGSGGAIIVYLRAILSLLSKAIGLVIVLMLIIAGVQYITSVGDPGAIGKAKKRITNAITALVLFLMMFAILTYLVPGGIL